MNNVSDMHIGRMLCVEGGEVREEAFECCRGGLPETYGVGVDVLTVNAARLVQAEISVCKDCCRWKHFDRTDDWLEIDERLKILHSFILWPIVVGIDDES